jgi:TolB-like protein/Tfp pilus assembly protein PilF
MEFAAVMKRLAKGSRAMTEQSRCRIIVPSCRERESPAQTPARSFPLDAGTRYREDNVVVDHPASADLTRRLRAVLFVDVKDSSGLVKVDLDGFVRRWTGFRNAVVHEDLPRRRGRMVKVLGDGMLFEFESAQEAVGCALDMQERIQRHEAAVPPERAIRLHIGINVAEIVSDDVDVYGDGVNLAARLCERGDAKRDRNLVLRARPPDGWIRGDDRGSGDDRAEGLVRAPCACVQAWPAGPLPVVSPDRMRRPGDAPAIAVLPFRNVSRDPAHDFLGDLIAEDLIAELCRMTDLSVISRLSTTPFRDREPRNVAEMLGVRYVLSGSVRALGGRLSLTAELAEEGHVLWAGKPFQGTVADMFDLQDQLSEHIATHVVLYIRNRELQRMRAKRSENLTAYERTLRAIDHLHRSSREDMEQARVILEGAIAADPEYAAPRAWLARWYVLRVGQGWSIDRDSDAIEANRHAEEAIDRDATDPWSVSVHGLVAAYLNKDLETAIARYDRALAINPSAASAWVWSTSALAWLGRGEEAVARSQRAIELSPFDPHRYYFNSIAGTAHAVAGKYEQAIELCQRALRENRMFFSAHRLLTISLALAGRLEEAKRAREELMRLEPNLTVAGWRSRYPGNASEHTERFCEALTMAGIPR